MVRAGFLALVLGLGCLSMAIGDQTFIAVENGYSSTGDAFWWKDGQRFTRTLITVPGGGYYSCGRYYQHANTYQWSYVLSPVIKQQAAYVAPKVPKYGAGWREEIIGYAKHRDDQAAYFASLQALGINVNTNGLFGGNNYGFGNSNLGNYGVNGQTIYGHTYQSVRDAYGDTNLNALYQQAGRLATNAQTIAGQAHTEHSELVSQAGNNAARIAEILAKGQSAANVLNAANAAASSRTVTTGQAFTTSTGGQVAQQQPSPMPRIEGAADNVALAALVNNKCLRCHGTGAEIKGGYDMRNLAAISREKRWVAFGKCVAGEMPEGGPQLSDDELKVLFQWSKGK